MLKNIKNITIVGAGNIGLASAVDISQNDIYTVTLLSTRAESLLNDFSKIDFETGKIIKGKNIKLTADYKEAFLECDAAIVTLPSFLIKDFVKSISSFSPKIIIFTPGYGGKEFYCAPLYKNGIIIAGTDRSPYVARLKNNNTVCASKKKQIRVGFMGKEDENALCTLLESFFEIKCSPLKNYLTVSLTPSNPILHTSRLYSLFKDCDFSTPFHRMIKFYAEWNNEASEIIFKMDKELLLICKAFKNIDLQGVVPNYVHYEADSIDSLTKKISSIESLKNITAPMKQIKDKFFIDSSSRYFREDFLHGLCNIKGFADIAGVETPCMDKVLKWYEKISKEELFDFNGNFCGKSLANTEIPRNFGFRDIKELENFYL